MNIATFSNKPLLSLPNQGMKNGHLSPCIGNDVSKMYRFFIHSLSASGNGAKSQGRETARTISKLNVGLYAT
jgi:hypothetical protein